MSLTDEKKDNKERACGGNAMGVIPAGGISHKIAKHVAEIPPSGIRRFFEMCIGMDDITSLGVGEPDFATPEQVRKYAIEILEKGQTSYTSNYGLIDLRVAIAEWIGKRYNLQYNPVDEMIITVGASEAIDIALRTICNPGDEVIVVEPCYVSYAPSVVLAGGKPIIYSTYQKENFRIDFDRMQKMVTPRTKAVLLNYPSNPSGATFRHADLEKLAAFLEKNDLLVLSDEIYAELTYEGKHESIGAFPGMKEHTILISGFSKAHAMTGWRLGYVCAVPELIAAMVKIHQYAIMCAPTISQYAGLEALRSADPDIEAMRQEYKERRDLIVAGFNSLGLKSLVPEGAFYAWASIEHTGMTSEQFCFDLLSSSKVAVVPGSAFGQCGEGFIRASYASKKEKIQRALDAIGVFLKTRG